MFGLTQKSYATKQHTLDGCKVTLKCPTFIIRPFRQSFSVNKLYTDKLHFPLVSWSSQFLKTDCKSEKPLYLSLNLAIYKL